ncbi:MAG: T9SS type A sorting domain-containing protein [Bacteroidales bacterium]
MFRLLLVIFFIGFFTELFPQDTLKLMQYNLLYYGKNTDFCTQNIDTKNQDLSRIVQHIKPDILGVNELDGEGAYPVDNDEEYLLNNALNTNGISHYKAAPFSTTYLANTLFYNSDKLVLDNHETIRFQVGDFEKIFNAYTFYYRSDDLEENSDTTFFTCFVVHLKAGSDNSNIQEKEDETEILMDFIENNYGEDWNYFIMGDLNVYTADEPAFQNLINDYGAYNVYDPIDETGNWHDNSSYSKYHTQSTHTSGDCHSGGGMDDRFDFILASASVMGGTNSVKYIEDSYETPGQDGESFNSTLTTTGNSTVPDDIAQALYNFSDHLPVTLKFEVDKNFADIVEIESLDFTPENPGIDDSVLVSATILDTQNRLEEVKLHWGYESGDYESTKLMKISDGDYAGSIPPVESHDKVYFMIRGVDEFDNILVESDEYYYEIEQNTGLFEQERNEEVPFEINNPVRENLKIWLNNRPESVNVQIGTLDGQELINKNYENTGETPLNVSLNELESGIYWLRIKTSETPAYGAKIILLNR